MHLRLQFRVLESLLACACAAIPVRAQQSTAAQGAAAVTPRLDSIARNGTAALPLASASVVVVRGQDTLLLAAYGEAERALHVAATPDTRYRWIGPGLAILAGVALHEAARGTFALDDDAARYLPQFPWQGRSVTVRQLLQSTSGLPDYHYLGDDFLATAAIPRTTEQVTALFAGRPFVHEPGKGSTWTVSGFHLAGVILERVTGQPYEVLAEQRVLRPAGLTQTTACGDGDAVENLAPGYTHTSATGQFRHFIYPSATLVRFAMGFCGTARDVARLVGAMPALLGPAGTRSWLGMDRPPVQVDPADTAVTYGLGVERDHEGAHHWWGFTGGNLMGYGSSAIRFPAESLTVVVLANTETGGTAWLARQLARAVLGLGSLSPPSRWAPLSSLRIPRQLLARVVGTYALRASSGMPAAMRVWRQSVRVYEEAGRLMVHTAGDPPEPLLLQPDGSFGRASDAAQRLVFTPSDGRATSLTLTAGRLRLEGQRTH